MGSPSARRGEVGGNGLGGQDLGVGAHGQIGDDVDAAEGAGPPDHLGDEGVGDVRGAVRQAVVGGHQGDISKDAEEAAALPIDGHESAHRHLLDGDIAVQLDIDPFGQGAADHHPQALSRPV